MTSPSDGENLSDPQQFDRLLTRIHHDLGARKDALAVAVYALGVQANRWRGHATALRVLAEQAAPREDIDPDLFEELRRRLLDQTANLVPPGRTSSDPCPSTPARDWFHLHRHELIAEYGGRWVMATPDGRIADADLDLPTLLARRSDENDGTRFFGFVERSEGKGDPYLLPPRHASPAAGRIRIRDDDEGPDAA